eukprot:COSAG02_NODE_63_length_43286_cov_54.666412_9_plen_126_part_00
MLTCSGPVSKMQFHMHESTARVDFIFIPVPSTLARHDAGTKVTVADRTMKTFRRAHHEYACKHAGVLFVAATDAVYASKTSSTTRADSAFLDNKLAVLPYGLSSSRAYENLAKCPLRSLDHLSTS